MEYIVIFFKAELSGRQDGKAGEAGRAEMWPEV
jgi:hypothetical protein